MLPGALAALQDKPAELSFTFSSQGPYGEIWEFSSGEVAGSITLHEDNSKVCLETIDVEPLGTGLGSHIMSSLKDYCDKCSKELLVPGVMNLDFFSRFPWLSWQEPGEGEELWIAKYSPALL